MTNGTNIIKILKNTAFFAVGVLLCCLMVTKPAYAQSAEYVKEMVDHINKTMPMQNGQRGNFDFNKAEWKNEEQKKAFMKAAMQTGLQITGMSKNDKKLYENVYNSQKKDIPQDAGFTEVMNEVLDNTKRDINLHGNNSHASSYESSADVAIDRLKDVMGESGLSAAWKTALSSTGIKTSKYTDYRSYVYAYKELEDKIALNPIGGYTTQSSVEKDSVMAMAERAKKTLDAMKAEGVITQDEFELEQHRITNLINMTVSDIKDQIDQLDISEEGKQELKERANEKKEEVVAAVMECSSIQYLRDKYVGSGCWACLVVERLTSSFLTAASKAYSLAQKAGLIALMLGSVLWVLIWGLKNVSSLSQVEAANVLNDLIKFGFKILLAYIFIIAGLKVVRNYIITPIMGTGAVIAQQFWTGKLSDVTEDYVWDDFDEKAVDKAVEVAIAAQSKTPIPGKEDEEPITTEYNPDQLKLLEEAKKAAEEAGTTSIPSFKIPGTNTGHLTSPVGCRLPVEVKCEGKKKNSNGKCYSSTSHMGLDIGTSGVEGGVVFAMATGKLITYCPAPCGGAGNMAIIQTTDNNGNRWEHRYLHMQAKTIKQFGNLTKKSQVIQGEQIGFIGNTGGSTGAHLHIDIKLTGKIGNTHYKNVYIDPLALASGKISPKRFSFNSSTKTYADNPNGCQKGQQDQFPDGFSGGKKVDPNGWMSSGTASVDLSSTYISSNEVSGANDLALQIKVPDIIYSGPTDIISKVIMNNIIEATKVITDNTAENMVLGDAIMCCAKLQKCGAWRIKTPLFQNPAFLPILPIVGEYIFITNFWMWLQGGLIWATGFLLTLAVAYYLVDISFKVGFAVIAMPIVVGLWPFKLTSGKFTKCISIIAKASATYAFLGFTTYFAIKLIGYNFSTDGSGNMDLAQIYQTIQGAMNGEGEDPAKDLADKTQLFSISFIILMFCLIYAFMIIQKSTSKLVNKFFPDNVFGDSAPMHHAATAATKAVKDLAMKPVKWAADVATYQGTKLVGRGVRRLLHGKGSGGSSDGGEAGRAVQKGGQAMKKGGKVMDKAGSALNKTKFGAIVGVPLQVAGKVTQAGGHVVEQTGKLAEQVGKKAKAIQKKMKKSLSRISKRRSRSKDEE